MKNMTSVKVFLAFVFTFACVTVVLAGFAIGRIAASGEAISSHPQARSGAAATRHLQTNRPGSVALKGVDGKSGRRILHASIMAGQAG